MGLNLVEGSVRSANEWPIRLIAAASWTIDLIRNYTISLSPYVGRVVLFGHPNPTSQHDLFFIPLKAFIHDELLNQIPILYVNGDGRHWLYQPNFFGQPSFLQMMVRGMTFNPPLKIAVHANGKTEATQDSFVYDQRLS